MERKIKSWQEFCDIVEHYFSFLLNELSYKITSNKEPKIIYASNLLKVVIFFEFGSRWDLDIRIESNKDSPLGNFSLGTWQFECLHKQNWSAVKANIPTFNADEFETIICVEAERIKTYCQEPLMGHFEDIRRIQLLHKEFHKRLTIEYQQKNRGKGYVALVDDLMNQIIKEQHWPLAL
jgi:hypothetical protein